MLAIPKVVSSAWMTSQWLQHRIDPWSLPNRTRIERVNPADLLYSLKRLSLRRGGRVKTIQARQWHWKEKLFYAERRDGVGGW